MTVYESKFLKQVVLTADVYVVCLQHALTTEKEEVMGLLIGEVDELNSISYITACVILHRSDKQPDRVEISPEQLYTATTTADQLALKLKRPMRVLGWYHSHPHITVWPSHVDVRTQSVYQTMDALFVGLIFSVYQCDKGSISNQIQLTCFQAINSNGSSNERREVEVVIINSPLERYNLEEISGLPKILLQEEIEIHDQTSTSEDCLADLHNEAHKTLTLVHLISKVSRPLCEDLEARLRALKIRIKEMEIIKKKLQNKLLSI